MKVIILQLAKINYLEFMSFASLTAGFCPRSRISSRTLKSILFWKNNLAFHRPAINTIRSLCVPWIIPRAEAKEQRLQGSIISWLFASQAVWLFWCHRTFTCQAEFTLPLFWTPVDQPQCCTTTGGAMCIVVYVNDATWIWAVYSLHNLT